MKSTKFKHPYIKYKDSPLWDTLQQAIIDLVENKDLVLQTKEEYVVGYICKAIIYKHPQVALKKAIQPL